MNIAVLEDDFTQSALVSLSIKSRGWLCACFDHGVKLLEEIKIKNFDAILIDWDLPDISGYDILNTIRNDLNIETPIIFVTSHSLEEDIVSALTAGANDYIIKPVQPDILLYRIETIVKKQLSAEQRNAIFSISGYSIDFNNKKISLKNEPIPLSNKEYEISKILILNFGKIVSRKFIIEEVWGKNMSPHPRAVDSCIYHIKEKLRIKPSSGFRLISIYSHGYRLDIINDMNNPWK